MLPAVSLSPGAPGRGPRTLAAGVRGLHGVGAGPVGGALVLEDVTDAVLVTLQSLAVAEVEAEIKIGLTRVLLEVNLFQ